jgi:hypothetical protein
MSIDNATPQEWNASNWHNRQVENHTTLGDYIKTKQVGGNHYKGAIEPWEAMLAWGLDPWACNVIKYVQRHRKKGGKQDLEKALHYLEFMISNYDAVGQKYYGE